MPWYRGDCHVHTDRSDGLLTAAEVAEAARSFGLDFIAVTEHNTPGAPAPFDDAGRLVIHGREVTTLTGHWLALGIRPDLAIDWDHGVRDRAISRQLDRVHRDGGLCVAAHPYAPYPSGTFMYSFDGFDLIEVWNGQWASDRPWNADNEAALHEWGRALSYVEAWRPAIGNSDTHLPGQIGVPHTVVHAAELSTTAILDGLRAGRSWITDSAAVSLTLTASAGGSTAGIGERLESAGATVSVRLSFDGVPEGTATLHTERGSFPAPAGEWQTAAEEAGFVRAEIRHPDGRMAALTNPIILA